MALTRMKSLGVKDIVLLFTRHSRDLPAYLRDKYGAEVHVYDDRDDRSYIPSVKPYLWSKYLQEDKTREQETYFYLDSDVVFRKLPRVSSNKEVWYGSDCTHYLGVDYIDSTGKGILEAMCEIVGVDANLIRELNPGAGAQWVITNPTYEYWIKVYRDSNCLYKHLNRMNYSKIQKWTAEMWAQLYNVFLFGKTAQVHEELDFAWSTDPISEYHRTNLLHNAGVLNDKSGLFFKGKYNHDSPFKADLSFVDPNRASIKYVEAIREVVGHR